MSQSEDLGVFGAVASNAKYEEIQHPADKTVQGVGHARILSALQGSNRLARNFCSASPDEFSAPTGSFRPGRANPLVSDVPEFFGTHRHPQAPLLTRIVGPTAETRKDRRDQAQPSGVRASAPNYRVNNVSPC